MILEYNERGEIFHTINVYQEAMPEFMRQNGNTFIQIDHTTVPNEARMNEDWWVDTSSGTPTLTPRPASPVAVSKSEIAANDEDTFEISGLMDGWELTIDGEYLQFIPGEPLEISSAIAHEYEIIAIAPWPYISLYTKVKAV